MSRARTMLRRAAPLVAVVVVGVLLTRREAPVAAQLRFVAAVEVAGLDAVLEQGGDEVASFRADAIRPRPGGELGRWPLRVPAGSYQVRVTVRRGGPPVEVSRSIELIDDAVVTIDLTPDLD